ncbi:MAG: LPS export ABC transporter periplasmic protein LptC [Betaproteobacteria bacterium]
MREPLALRIVQRLLTWFPVVLLASLAMLTYWLDAQVQRGTRGDRQGAKDPDYYVEDFAATRFGKDGSVIQRLAAKKLTHYPEGTPTDVIEPQLVNTPPGKPPMRVRADTGRISSDNENVYLTGNVVGIRDPAGGHGKLTVSTEFLHITPRDEKADSDKRVTIVDDNGTHTGGALRADNKARTLSLRNGVTGEIRAHPK